ncbi:dynein heavy chain axonemal-like protein [Lasius niger]|uniref:Dynein heavy chain axonemal-like protein n=1 Tax=Lasius niger TaxID=67767 RepID=A0A0J7K1L9_LASNI|nr:dynein heavy chain axonemal-like protein [Lasius niger]
MSRLKIKESTRRGRLVEPVKFYYANVDNNDNVKNINVQFTILRLAIEKQLEKKQKLITMFETQIQKDMTMLSDKLSAIDDEVRQSWLLDVASNPDIYLDTQRS